MGPGIFINMYVFLEKELIDYALRNRNRFITNELYLSPVKKVRDVYVVDNAVQAVNHLHRWPDDLPLLSLSFHVFPVGDKRQTRSISVLANILLHCQLCHHRTKCVYFE